MASRLCGRRCPAYVSHGAICGVGCRSQGVHWMCAGTLGEPARQARDARPAAAALKVQGAVGMALLLFGANAQRRTLRTGNTRAGGLRQVTWVPNEWVEKCINCSAEFSIFKWKNHCRLCGRSGALLDQWIRARHSSADRPAALPTCGYACAVAPWPADSDTAG
jgi:hypothetical protein